VKAKLGVTSGQVQEVKAGLRDYAFKYGSACRNRDAGRIIGGQYNCRPDNMDSRARLGTRLGAHTGSSGEHPNAVARRDMKLMDIETIQELAKAHVTV
jgi:hypothetical protein